MTNCLKIFSLITILMFSLTACAPKIGPYDASADSAGRLQSVQHGVVTAVHQVVVNNDGSIGSTVGTVGGAIAGALIGNLFGGGTGNTLATIGGGLAGAAGGYYAGQAVQTQTGYQIEVRLNDGRLVSVIQGDEYTFGLGQAVSVIGSGTDFRVVPR